MIYVLNNLKYREISGHSNRDYQLILNSMQTLPITDIYEII